MTYQPVAASQLGCRRLPGARHLLRQHLRPHLSGNRPARLRPAALSAVAILARRGALATREFPTAPTSNFCENGGTAFPSRHGFLTSNYLTFVHDNSLWVETGPDRRRARALHRRHRHRSGQRPVLTAGSFRRTSAATLRTSLATASPCGARLPDRGERPPAPDPGRVLRPPRLSAVHLRLGDRCPDGQRRVAFPADRLPFLGFPLASGASRGFRAPSSPTSGGRGHRPRSDRGALGAHGFSMRMNLGFPAGAPSRPRLALWCPGQLPATRQLQGYPLPDF